MTVSDNPYQEVPRVTFAEKLKNFWEIFSAKSYFTKLSIIIGILLIVIIPLTIGQETGLLSHAGISLFTTCTPIPPGFTQDQIQKLSASGKVRWCSNSLQQSRNNTNITVSVGDEEYVAGPQGTFDTNVFFMPVGNTIFAYDANGTSNYYTGTNLSSVNWSNPVTMLTPGKSGEFDSCGAWLLSTYKITETHMIGWYHAESPCTSSGSGPYWSVAFAESFDAGKTWQKTGYPNNQILTGDTIDINTAKYKFSGTRVISDGTYFYIESAEAAPVALARSKVSDLGKPGTWYKWYCDSSGSCGFTQSGIGGHATPIKYLGGQVVYDTYLGKYISIMNSQGYGDEYGRKGFSLSISNGNTLTSWTPFNDAQTIYPMVSFSGDTRVDHWSQNQSNLLSVYAYPAFVDPSGDSSHIAQSFYLYYMKMFPGDTFSNRYLMRRLITLHKGDSGFTSLSSSSSLSTVELTRYQNTKLKKILVSTEIARPSEGYAKVENIGRVLSYPAQDFKPLYLCYIPLWNDYLPTDVDPSKYNWQHCENPNGDNFIRTLGYISTKITPETPIAIYRCFDPANLSHFISTDPKCEGKQYNWRLGYIFAEQSVLDSDLTVTLTPAQSIQSPQLTIIPKRIPTPSTTPSISPVHRLNPGGRP